jgi:Arc/MetJ family transcription regulator
MICQMKKTLHIDEKLLAEARAVSGATTDTETVRLGLHALVRHAAYQRLRSLRGTEPTAKDVSRRREGGRPRRRVG